ncbi:sterol desaturase family protein [Aquabacterium sp.]|uniref:sterol desaturase family protein n=1 Tax=Aquabacterium sp. TaxID=1872578 RepID=UPI0035AF8731
MDDILHALGFVVVAGSVFLLLIAWESWVLVKQRGQTDAYAWPDVLSNISMGFLYKAVDAVVVSLIVTVLYDHVRALGMNSVPANPVLAVCLMVVVTDFTYWFVHYFMHKVRWGWVSHVSHHSSDRFNLSTALRQNFLFDLTGVAFLWWLPLALIGFDKYWAVVAVETSLFYQFFIHTQVVRKLPAWVEMVFNTPSHHRVHHGSNPAQIDTNFGGMFIVWDKLFGTFQPEETAGPLKFGLTERQPHTYNPLRLNTDEFRLLWRDLWHYRDLRILWKGPNWVEQRYGR